MQLSDLEIVRGLIERDGRVTEWFLYEKCRPLFMAIMRHVLGCRADYDEMVGELYAYLMADDCDKLRRFEYRSSVYQWIKVVATRFFIRHRDSVIGGTPKNALYEGTEECATDDAARRMTDRMDVASMLDMMDNRRYADVIRCLVLDDMEPERYAVTIGVSVDNLYNIKRRAMAAFTRIALKYYSYGR